jgi:RNA polymerase sigma-70 factor, ECF subfamily
MVPALKRPPPPPDELDQGVLERCRRRDPLAFRAFVVRYERMVFALLSRMLGRGPAVEDLAQEAFLRAFRAFPSFDPRGPARVSTWLLTIATRLAVDERRKRRDHEPVDEDGFEAPGPDPEGALAGAELGDAIERAADSLGDEQRAVFLLVEMHGRTMIESAEILGIPEATVKTRLFRARQKMRGVLLPFTMEGNEEVS